MTSLDTLATFFGWCTVINFGVIVMIMVFFAVAHEWIGKISAGLFGITTAEAKATMFHVFMFYRLGFLVLNLVPYIALKIMT